MGERREPATGADPRRHHGRGLRPLDAPGHRPARPDRAGGARRRARCAARHTPRPTSSVAESCPTPSPSDGGSPSAGPPPGGPRPTRRTRRLQPAGVRGLDRHLESAMSATGRSVTTLATVSALRTTSRCSSRAAASRGVMGRSRWRTSAAFRIPSMPPKADTSATAVFAPMPGTPGRPSDGSPRRTAMSTYDAGVDAEALAHARRVEQRPLLHAAVDGEVERRPGTHDLDEVTIARHHDHGPDDWAARLPTTSSAS